jgi:hypothetical protein
LERYLSAKAEGVVVVPELRRFGREANAFLETAATFPGAAEHVAGIRSALKNQLGLDPLDPDALSRAGLDPARGAALGLEPAEGKTSDRSPLLVLPCRDPSALESYLTDLARDRLGAPAHSAQVLGDIRVVTFRFVSESPPVLTVAFQGSGRIVAVSQGPAGAAAALAAFNRPAKDSLAEAPAWRALRGALGDRYAILAGAVPPSPALPPALKDGTAVGLSAETGVLRAGIAVRPSTSPAKLGAHGDASSKLRALSLGSALVLRFDGDPSELGRRALAFVSAHDQEWLREHGLDLQRDLFDLLSPGCAASLSLSPRFDLSDLSETAVRADLLKIVRFELVAEVKDEEATRRVLLRLPALLSALSAPLGREAKEAPSVSAALGQEGRIATPSGELAYRLDGKRLTMAGGPKGSLTPLLLRASGKSPGYASPTKASATALSGGLGGVVLDPRSLSKSVRALPEEAFGTGPTGFLVRSIAERFLEPAERITALSARAELSGEVVRVELLVEAPLPGKEAPR